MSEQSSVERMEILKMLSEGKITAEEAERLLLALEKSYGTKQDTDSGGYDKARRGNEDFGFFSDIFDHIDTAVRSIFGSGDDRSGWSDQWFRMKYNQAKKPDDNQLFIDPNTEVTVAVIGHWKEWIHSNALRAITITQKDQNPILFESGYVPAILKLDQHVILFVESEQFEMTLPSHISALNCFGQGGNVNIKDVTSPVRCKTMGGKIHLVNVNKSVHLKTLGGSVSIEQWTPKDGKSRIKTMGGNIHVELSPESSLRIFAQSLGGKIFSNIAPDKDAPKPPFFMDGFKGVIGKGDGSLRIESAGGSVHITKLNS